MSSFLSTIRETLAIMWAVTVTRFRILSRYKGWIIMDMIMPLLITMIPILLGRAAGGSGFVEAFEKNTGTDQYIVFLLIGSNVFMVVTAYMWLIGMWIRRERMTGTLESVYVTASHRMPILLGTTLYTTIRSMVVFTLSLSFGCLVFWVNPFQGNIMLAVLFLFLGMLPLFGLSLIFASLIFKIKEAGSLMNLLQWVVMLLMGVYYPITVFPPLLRVIAYSFPPTWLNNGVRASMLDLSYFFEHWYFDLAIIGVFIFVFPMIGWFIFSYTDKHMRRSEGVGQF